MGWQFDWKPTWKAVWEEGFQALWNQVLHSSSHTYVYHRPEVVRAWAETRGAAIGARPMLGIAQHTAGTHALLPWVIVTYRGRFVVRRVLEPAGQSLFGYHDPLVGQDEAGAIDWPAFWDAVHQDVRGCCDQALFRFVDPRYAQGPLSELCGEESPVLDLSGLSDLDALLRRCSRSHRGDVHRQFRRLVDAGTPSLWIADAATVREALADLHTHFFPAIDAGWGRKPSGSIARQAGMTDFLTRVVAEGVPAGWGHYSVLQVSGTPIAWHLGFFDASGLYYWLPSYDSKWEHLSPGKMLLALLIKHAIEHGWPRIHLQTGGQPYKLAWQPTRLQLRAVRWHAPTWRGAVLACWDAARRPAAQLPLEP